MQRGWYGFKPVPAPLLTAPRDNVKFAKTAAPTYGLSLTPAMTSQWNACTHSTRTCRKHCVAFAGKGGLSSVLRGRLWRTALWAEAPDAAYAMLRSEIGRAIYRHDGPIRVRLNTFSDVAWERVLPESFWTLWGDYVRFYDYTKDVKRALASKHWRYPYKLTFSASERTTDREIQELTEVGVSVAVVFSTPRSQPLPTSYVGVRVINGDASDDRWLDASGVIVGLRAKGSMRGDTTGFVREASA